MHFVLTANDGQTIGKSRKYVSGAGRGNGSGSISRQAPDAQLLC